MEKSNLLLLIFIGMIFCSCQPKINLKSDEHLSDTFSKGELNEMEKMIGYVDEMVLSKTGKQDINQAYHQYLNELNKHIQDSSKFLVLFKEEEKYEFLESLDSTVFNEFFRLDSHIRMTRYKDTVYRDLENYKHLNLQPGGRYLEYLKKVGETDAFYESVTESTEIAGDLSPAIAVYFPEQHEEFNFTVPKNRLWAAVYLLRIEEHHDKKMERYLKWQENQ